MFSTLFSLRKRSRRTRRTPSPWSGEQLEVRSMLDSSGLISGVDATWSISFVPDGANIAGEPNVLAAKFEPLGDWQATIVEAFQTWALHTRADVGIVSDSGDAFGVPGASHGDNRFGDIRVGARPLDSGVAAISVPSNRLGSSTWLRDVVFNSDFNFTSLDDVFAVALHEAGNVYGLEDSDDPNSPLHPGEVPIVRQPTSTDIQNLQTLHGSRPVDPYESPTEHPSGTGNNDTLDTATRIEFDSYPDLDEGSAPILLYGDITTPEDVDSFHFKIPGDYHGEVTVRVRTDGFSALAPSVQVFDNARSLVTSQSSSLGLGNDLVLNLPLVQHDQTYYVQIAGATDNAFGIGGYSLAVSLDQRDTSDESRVLELTDGRYHFLSTEDLHSLLVNETDFLRKDDGSDDELDSATELVAQDEFENSVRFEVIGSIEQPHDRDSYKLKSPDSPAVSALLISIESIERPGLIPDVELLDGDGERVPLEILVNGGGMVLAQARNILPDDEYFLEVMSSDAEVFRLGNYRLSVEFLDEARSVDLLAEDTLEADSNLADYTLFVARPQLFHLLLDVPFIETESPVVLVTRIMDSSDHLYATFAARPGQTRSGPSLLLLPGEYRVDVQALVEGNVPLQEQVEFALHSSILSDPLVINLDDPTDQPFACNEQGQEGAFCYPNGNVSTTPHQWTSNGTFQETSAVDPFDITTWRFGDWWSWYWNQQNSSTPPVTQSESYELNSNARLDISIDGGALANDVSADTQPMVAVLAQDVQHGTLSLAADGSFSYTPESGFVGTDQFTYQAFDFVNPSPPVAVTLSVYAAGDLDFDGRLSAGDVDALSFALRTNEASLRFDLNGDDNVDREDRNHLIYDMLRSRPGDANLDGQVDGLDFSAWQSHVFQSTTGWSQGDFNGDGSTDVADFNLWLANRFETPQPSAIVTARHPRAARSASLRLVEAFNSLHPAPPTRAKPQLTAEAGKPLWSASTCRSFHFSPSSTTKPRQAAVNRRSGETLLECFDLSKLSLLSIQHHQPAPSCS